MDDGLQITVRDGASGKLAVINGKTYTLLRLYQDVRMGGIFCLIVAGRTPLRTDDLAEHWKVFKSGHVHMGLDCRPFSYHLIEGEGTQTDAPRWPRLKTPAAYYAFVGASEEAVKTQIRLTLERYHSKAEPQLAIERALRVQDACGGPPAYLIRSEWL